MNLLFVVVPLFIIVVFFIVFISIILALVRRSPRRVIVPARRVDVVTRLGQDGFWVESCPADPGALIHFHYWSNGIRHAGQIPYTPDVAGHQFVYTGLTPAQVVILRVVEAGDMLDYGIVPPIIDIGMDIPVSSPPDYFDSPPPAPNFPPAY